MGHFGFAVCERSSLFDLGLAGVSVLILDDSACRTVLHTVCQQYAATLHASMKLYSHNNRENIDKGNFAVSRRYRQIIFALVACQPGIYFRVSKGIARRFQRSSRKVMKDVISRKLLWASSGGYTFSMKTSVKRRSRGFYAFRGKIPRYEVADFSCGSTDASHQPVSWIHNLVYQHEQRVGRKIHAKEREYERERERGGEGERDLDLTLNIRHSIVTSLSHARNRDRTRQWKNN